MGLASPSSRDQLEREILAHAQAESWQEAATRALQGYGAEILGFLHGVVSNPTDADEVFSSLCEIVWTRLPGFRFESTFRTWLYSIARNLARDRGRAWRRQRRRFTDLDGSPVSQIEAQVRSTTAIHLRSQTKTRLQAIRDSLPSDERVMLVLRLDREMSWTDIARVLADEPLDDGEAAKESARLRKRFERVKTKVAELLRADAGS